MISDQDKLYTKIVEFKSIQNFLVDNFFNLSLQDQILNISSRIRFEIINNVEWRQSQHQSYSIQRDLQLYS
jgi:hypothetical protein